MARDTVGSDGGNETAVSTTSEAYDFHRLERAVEYLLDEHARLARENEQIERERAELRDELVERERRLTSLESELVAERGRRRSALEGVDKILGRIEQLQSSVAGATAAEGA